MVIEVAEQRAVKLTWFVVVGCKIEVASYLAPFIHMHTTVFQLAFEFHDM